MVIQNLSIFLFLSIIDFLLITVTITHIMIITRTQLTTPTSMPPDHEPPLVDELLLTWSTGLRCGSRSASCHSDNGYYDINNMRPCHIFVHKTKSFKINNHLGQRNSTYTCILICYISKLSYCNS